MFPVVGQPLKDQVYLLKTHHNEKHCRSLVGENKIQETNEKQIYPMTYFRQYMWDDSYSAVLGPESLLVLTSI